MTAADSFREGKYYYVGVIEEKDGAKSQWVYGGPVKVTLVEKGSAPTPTPTPGGKKSLSPLVYIIPSLGIG